MKRIKHRDTETQRHSFQSLAVSLCLCVSDLIFGLMSGARARQTTPAKVAPVTFVEVPSKSSGINWTHNNAHSDDRQLPETVGAGCAFLDYDNDGWAHNL